MISKEEIDRTILELEQKDTTFTTCERLAWLYIVRDHITKQHTVQPAPLSVNPDSEFLQTVDGKDSVMVFNVIDDLMDTLKATAPRVYYSVMQKVREIE